MHAPALLTDIVIVFAVAVVVVLVLTRLRLPTIAGFIAAGALVGPSGFGLVGRGEGGTSHIESLAEIGVVLLLFTIGLEFSIERIRRIWRTIALGGSLQVGVTIAAVLGVTASLGVSVPRGVFFGFLVAMSSTAIVLRALAERRETDAPHGRMTVGVLVFQDLCVVPMMLLVPMLAGEGGSGRQIAWALGKAAIMIAGTLLVARQVAPRVLGIVARSKQRELFLLAALLTCVGVAWVTSLAGLSLALGAFLAGIALADSEYGHQALAEVLPFREAFTSLFFISIGMLFDGAVVLQYPGLVFAIAGAVLLGKWLVVSVVSALIGFPLRAAVLAGVGLAGIGEFSFVLAQVGREAQLLSPLEHRLFVAVSVITVVITPIAIRLGPRIAAGMSRLRRLERLLLGNDKGQPEPVTAETLSNHVIIAGYGVAGRLLGEALGATGIGYTVCDLNPDAVRAARERGVQAFYGDITSMEMVEHLGVHHARELVILINDPEAAKRALTSVRRLMPRLPIVIRTKYVAESKGLKELGATDVIVEELETGMEIAARVMRAAGVPRNLIQDRLRVARGEGIQARPMTVPRRALGEVGELADLKVETFLVSPGHWVIDKTLGEVHLFAAGAGFVAAIKRQSKTITNPKAFEAIQEGDVLYLLAAGGKLDQLVTVLETGEPGDEVHLH